MASPEERIRILKMIEEGKLSAEQGAKLIAALKTSREKEQTKAKENANAQNKAKPKTLRVRVGNTHTGKTQVNVSLPLSLVDVALTIGTRFTPEMKGIPVEDIMRAIQSGATGKIVDVDDDDNHVEIFVE